MTFGDKLVVCRKKKNMSQEQVAEKLGVSRQAVSRWEAEGTMPDACNLKKLGELYGVSIDYLLDDACDEEEKGRKEVVSASDTAKLFRISLALMICGFIGVVILFICSTQIEAIEMQPLVHSDEVQIDTNQRMSGVELYLPKKVHSFFPFLSYYNLSLVALGFAAMFIFGSFLLTYVQKRTNQNQKGGESNGFMVKLRNRKMIE